MDNYIPIAHDLVWITSPETLLLPTPHEEWVSVAINSNPPLVVRRDDRVGFIPVGIRGYLRHQRYPLWIPKEVIHSVATPSMLSHAAKRAENRNKFESFPAFNTLLTLLENMWPWEIGVTGSLAISIATGKTYVTMNSDLDITIRCSTQQRKLAFNKFKRFIETASVRIDTQIETPTGGFALNEWLTSDIVMLKTNTGPKIVNNPWSIEEIL